MALVRDIIGFLDELLDAPAFSDYGPNGLQVPGRDAVDAVVTGVSAHGELLERAAASGAGLVLVHHGLFWRGQALHITSAMHRRLKVLFDADMALAAYHLPLDAHPEHGNNALLAAGLDGSDAQPFAAHEGRPIGVHVRFAGDGLTLEELVGRTTALCGRAPLVVAGGPPAIRSLGIVSGAGTDFVHEALRLGLDAFLTGEPAERAYGIARDEGIHFLAAGHHATETFGVRRLGELLHERFGVVHEHVDIRNPI